MKTFPLFAVLSAVVLSPLFTFAYVADPFAPGSSPSTPIYVEIEQNPWDATRQGMQGDNPSNAQPSYWDNAKQQHKEFQQQQPQIQYAPYPVYQPSAPAQALTLDQRCKYSYGSSSYGANNSCYCATGYEWATDKRSCIPSVNVNWGGILGQIQAQVSSNPVTGGAGGGGTITSATVQATPKKMNAAQVSAKAMDDLPKCNENKSNTPCKGEPVAAFGTTTPQKSQGFWAWLWGLFGL